ncbi:hypothetical protein SNE40_020788 [Patella caerulea]|uniref:Uncharacterized protein n=1 Tax=Patella caerulea TaxID=87958 RepID=A0AAN8J4Z4_PATCE
MFDILEDKYLELHKQDLKFCLLGDVNSRTGQLQDTVTPNTSNHTVYNHLDDYMIDNSDLADHLKSNGCPIMRTSKDTIINRYGERLIEMCLNLGICIANGRSGKDTNVGNYTCDEKSVVDYMICSPQLLYNIEEFYIGDFENMLSDKHCPIHIALTSVLERSRPPIKTSNCNTRPVTKINWKNDLQEDFSMNINEDEISRIDQILYNTEPCSVDQTGLDYIVKLIGNIFRESAAISGISRTISVTPNDCTKRKSTKKPWFNEICELKRKAFFCAKNTFKSVNTYRHKQSKTATSELRI